MADVHDGTTLRAALAEIANDFSFSWTPGARALFGELAPERFSQLGHNPTALLTELTDDDLAHALTPEYAVRLGHVQERLAAERESVTWWHERHAPDDFLVAYFSTEFGLDESLPIYSGGLGILAGDHLKAASELGVPLVGVGLYYRRGYFRQRLDEGDRQVERYPRLDTNRLPLTLVPMAPVVELANADGELVPDPARRLAREGRARLAVSARHEGRGQSRLGARRHRHAVRRRSREPPAPGARARGRRRARAAQARPRADGLPHERGPLGVPPARAAARARRGGGPRPRGARSSGCAARRCSRRTRPSPPATRSSTPDSSSGTSAHLVARGGLSWNEFAELGKLEPDDTVFGLTPFALRTALWANGVSELHGAVSREMWHALWPDSPVDQVPITLDHERRARAHVDLRRARGPARPSRRRTSRARSSSPTRCSGRRIARPRTACSSSSRARAAPTASIPTRSRSASRAASRRTSGPACCSASRSG